MAEERVRPFKERSFFHRYSVLLEDYWVPLQHNALHQTVLRQIQAFTEKGVALPLAVKRVLRKHKAPFEDLFDANISDSEEDSEEDSDESV